MEEKDIRNNIIRLRKEHGLSQTQMADRINLCRNAYREIELGPTKIFHHALYKIAEEFGITPLKLIVGRDLNDTDLVRLEEMKVIYDNKFHNSEKDYIEQIAQLHQKVETLKTLLHQMESNLEDKNQIIALQRTQITELTRKINNP